MQQEGKTLSISEYARLRNLNKSTISRQVAEGKIPTHDGRVDPVEADAARARNLDSSKVEAATLRKRATAQSRPPAPRRVSVEPNLRRAQRPATPAAVISIERSPEPNTPTAEGLLDAILAWREPNTPTAEGLLDAILAWRDRLPALFHRMGASVGVAVLSGEILEALVLSITGTAHGPIPSPTDFAAIAADLGVSEAELKAIYDACCEPWSGAIGNFFDRDPHYADGLSPIREAGK